MAILRYDILNASYVQLNVVLQFLLHIPVVFFQLTINRVYFFMINLLLNFNKFKGAVMLQSEPLQSFYYKDSALH